MRAPSPSPVRARSGFSLLEIVLVVLLITILAGVMAPAVATREAEARDARRLSDLQALVGAIEQYHVETGGYPAGQPSAANGGWDVSHDGGLLPELVRGGFLNEMVVDPINDATYHFAYHRYPADAYGCDGGPFFVVGIRRMETAKYADFKRGSFRCRDRDWDREFAYVTGGGARAN